MCRRADEARRLTAQVKHRENLRALADAKKTVAELEMEVAKSGISVSDIVRTGVSLSIEEAVSNLHLTHEILEWKYTMLVDHMHDLRKDLSTCSDYCQKEVSLVTEHNLIPSKNITSFMKQKRFERHAYLAHLEENIGMECGRECLENDDVLSMLDEREKIEEEIDRLHVLQQERGVN